MNAGLTSMLFLIENVQSTATEITLLLIASRNIVFWGSKEKDQFQCTNLTVFESVNVPKNVFKTLMMLLLSKLFAKLAKKLKFF